MKLAPLLAVLLALPAAAADPECAALGNKGCWYASPGGIGDPALLVYFRGHWNYTHTNPPPADKGTIPPAKRLASSRQAFKDYGLKELAIKENLVVIVTGSSDVSISEDDIKAVKEASGVNFVNRYLAAHSGGYVGLQASLPKLGPVNRIVMLDNFYFDQTLSKLVQDRVAAGAECDGFYTGHNRERVKSNFIPVVAKCPLDTYENSDHDAAVPRCLGSYLNRATCL